MFKNFYGYRKLINGHEFIYDGDFMSGACFWTSDGYNEIIYATPFWDGVDCLVIQVDDGFNTGSFEIPFDKNDTFFHYANIMTKFIELSIASGMITRRR